MDTLAFWIGIASGMLVVILIGLIHCAFIVDWEHECKVIMESVGQGKNNKKTNALEVDSAAKNNA